MRCSGDFTKSFCEDGHGIGRLRVYVEDEAIIDKYAVIDVSSEDMERITSIMGEER